MPYQSAYCASKFAVRGFTDSLRCELLHDNRGVRISMVQLPAMNTPQFDWVKSRLPNRLSTIWRMTPAKKRMWPPKIRM